MRIILRISASEQIDSIDCLQNYQNYLDIEISGSLKFCKHAVAVELIRGTLLSNFVWWASSYMTF